ncbi:hypothetical protein DBV05_g4248 [Lasiodiplodia theobromae]|uniref:Heterokaryon incompatibility domain-containing protein n=1 Tax=Lasiodiplodia theobromae TaxID=45133 RepID=A0A5N5DJM7_9PEZI|nr:hypothetical protein DBV05_g4248 [Lasiodiplodia theobromae]
MDFEDFPGFIPSNEAQLSAKFEEEMKDLSFVFIVLNSSRYKLDADDAQIFIPQQPHVVRATPLSQDPIEIESVHSLCRACLNAFNYYCHFIADDKEACGIADDQNMPFAVMHHRNIRSLMETAANGQCSLCSQLLEALRAPAGPQNSDDLEHRRLEMCWGPREADGGNHLYFVWTDRRRPRQYTNYNTYYRLRLWPVENGSLDAHLHLSTADDEEKGQLGEIAANDSSGSVASARVSKAWLKQCLENADGAHDECNNASLAGVQEQSSRSHLPTRVLDVETARRTGRLRLVCPEADLDATSMGPADLRYITLSHCWGQWGAEELPVLTTRNVDERREAGASLADLPRTFREAVEVAGGWFGVRWLWIDSLCILQDSPADWAREAAAMASTYRRALLNLSADHAADARGGLFVKRRREDDRVLRLRAGDHRAWWCVAFDTFACHWAGRAPSFDRAWIHHERQIARRVLHFTEAEVMWECCAKADEESSSPSTPPPSRSFKTETFPGGVPFRRPFARPGQSVGNAKWQTRRDVRDAVAATEGRDARVRELWRDVCEEFARKGLTKASDMPVIMSSLAEEFRALLPEDATSPTTYGAPSWSWMSASQPIARSRFAKPQTPIARIEDDGNLAALRDQFGTPLPGVEPSTSLTITGFIRHVGVVWDRVSFTPPRTVGSSPYICVQHHYTMLVNDEDGNDGYDGGDGNEEEEKSKRLRSVGVSWRGDSGADFECHLDHYGGRDDGNRSSNSKVLQAFCLFVEAEHHQLPRRYVEVVGLLLQPVEKASGGRRVFRRIGMVELSGRAALKLRYRVKPGHSMEEGDWEENLRNVEEAADIALECRRREGEGQAGEGEYDGAISDLYLYDAKIDMTALERLKPQTITLI